MWAGWRSIPYNLGDAEIGDRLETKYRTCTNWVFWKWRCIQKRLHNTCRPGAHIRAHLLHKLCHLRCSQSGEATKSGDIALVVLGFVKGGRIQQ